MSETGEQATIVTLSEVLRNDPSPEVRAEAALALATRAGQSTVEREAIVQSLLGSLEDEHDLPRRAAIYGLREHVDEPIARRLTHLLREAPELWREAAVALAGSSADLVSRELRELLTDAPDARSRRGAARALGSESHDLWSRDRVPVDRAEEHPLFGYEGSDGIPHPTA